MTYLMATIMTSINVQVHKEAGQSTNYRQICLNILDMIFLAMNYLSVKEKFKYFRFKIVNIFLYIEIFS